jgi:hypothetical protein
VANAVTQWFAERDEVPLVPPPRFYEYAPVLEESDCRGIPCTVDEISAIAFGLNYCDLRGWASTRTVRCIGIDAGPPETLWAYCAIRKTPWPFRLDRIISVANFRTGLILEADRLDQLLAADIPGAELRGRISDIASVRIACRDGVYVLMSLAMKKGRLSHEAREVVLNYVDDEIAASGLKLGRPGATRLWIDNLSPPRTAVISAIERLLLDKSKLTRVMSWSVRAMAAEGPLSATEEASGRQLILAVRDYYREQAELAAIKSA